VSDPAGPAGPAIEILVDADACPVKGEVYKVAGRYKLPVKLVANAPMARPQGLDVEVVVVSDGFDAADDWIAERARGGTIVVTADIPLAQRCLAAGAVVIGPRGKPFDQQSIGMARATRDLLDHLRAGGTERVGGGPPPLGPKDRSRFLSALDEAVVRLRRRPPMPR